MENGADQNYAPGFNGEIANDSAVVLSCPKCEQEDWFHIAKNKDYDLVDSKCGCWETFFLSRKPEFNNNPIWELWKFGFEYYGQFACDSHHQLQIEKSEYSEEPERPALYAFVSVFDLLYLGTTSGRLKRRLSQYAKFGSGTSTNSIINDEIRNEVAVRLGNIQILFWQNPFPTQEHNGYELNLACGLEASFIQRLRPRLNRRQN